MRIVKFTVLVILLLGFCSYPVSANGFENTGIGTYARGMAGAYRAVANDWTAAYYNPAGFAFALDNQLGTSLGLIHNRDELVPNYWYRDNFGNRYATGVINDNTLFNHHEILNNPSAGLILRLPVWGETVFGLSAYQPFDYKIAWRLYDPEVANFRAYHDGISASLPDDQWASDLDVVAFQVSAGHSFSEDKVAIGIGLQLLRGDLVFNEMVLRPNPRSGIVAERPRDHIAEFSHNDLNGWGFGATGGVMFKPTEKLSIGISGRVPFEMTLDGDVNLRYFLPANNKIAVDPSQVNSVDNLFVSGEIISLNGQGKTKLKLPASIGGGVAFQATEKLLVSIDAEYTFWSVFEGFSFAYSSFDPSKNNKVDSVLDFFTADLSRPADWTGAGKVAVGLKYDATPTLSLLGGVSVDQSPLRDNQLRRPQLIDTGDKVGFNGGAVFHVNRWDLGVIVSYFDYPDQQIGLLDINGDGINDTFPGSYKAQTFETILSLNYRF